MVSHFLRTTGLDDHVFRVESVDFDELPCRQIEVSNTGRFAIGEAGLARVIHDAPHLTGSGNRRRVNRAAHSAVADEQNRHVGHDADKSQQGEKPDRQE